MKIGAQLYTVHDYTKTLEDLSLSLKKVADIGYKTVQVSGTCPFDPVWMRDELQKNGLQCVITHVAPAKIAEDPVQVVRDHSVFGCTHIGIGGMPTDMRGSVEGYERFSKIWIPIAEQIRDMGAKLHYHNHDWEFVDLEGKHLIDRIFEDFPEDSIDFTLDLGWAGFAGQDVVALINKLKGRLSHIHLKDYADKPADGSITTKAYLRPIYEGKLDYDAYIKALAAVGTEHMLVEQDNSYDEDPFDCLRRSYENVTKRFPEVK